MAQPSAAPACRYFVLLAWGVASCTAGLGTNMVERVRLVALCETGTSTSCRLQLVLLTANVAMTILAVLLLVLSAWLALRLSEKIQEEEEEAQAAERERIKTVMAVMHSRSKSMARRNSKMFKM
jgi:Ca2+/Na+ antiporter